MPVALVAADTTTPVAGVPGFDRSVRNHGSRRVRNHTGDHAAGLPKCSVREGQYEKKSYREPCVSHVKPLCEIQTHSALSHCPPRTAHRKAVETLHVSQVAQRLIF